MEGISPSECTCGSQNFERIVVERRGSAPYRTEFIACAGCRVMYYCQEPAPPPPPVKWTGSVIEPHKVRPK